MDDMPLRTELILLYCWKPRRIADIKEIFMIRTDREFYEYVEAYAPKYFWQSNSGVMGKNEIEIERSLEGSKAARIIKRRIVKMIGGAILALLGAAASVKTILG